MQHTVRNKGQWVRRDLGLGTSSWYREDIETRGIRKHTQQKLRVRGEMCLAGNKEEINI